MTYNTSTTTAASGEVNANLEVAKNVRLIANTFFGSGNGRYIFAQAPDVVIRPTAASRRSTTYSTVDGFEANITKNTLLYAYYGGIYIGRDQCSIRPHGSTLAKPVYVGYGFRVLRTARTAQFRKAPSALSRLSGRMLTTARFR